MAYLPSPKPLPAWADSQAMRQRIEAALRDTDAEAALIGLVRELYADGLDEAELLGLIVAAQARRRELEDAGHPIDERAEDAIVNVADRVAGLCVPQALLQRGPPLDFFDVDA